MKNIEKAPIFNDLDQNEVGHGFIKFMQTPDLHQKLSDIDKGYPYWDRFKQQVKGIDGDPRILWLFNKLTRQKAISIIKICDIQGFTFKFNTTARILKYLHEFDLHLGGILEGRSIIPPEDKPRYLISSIMEEAIASSQLEGAATTREIAKEMLRTNRKPQNISEKMILNNYLTIRKVLEIKDQKVTKDLILELHSIVSKDTLENSSYEGTFRSNDKINVVDPITNEIFYTPPTHKNVDELMTRFCEFANSENEKEFIHPIIKGIILHFLIGYIHPFFDGNGRTARAIFYWYLLSKGYWLIEYMSISKVIIRSPAQYARAYLYSEYDENDLTYFIDYNLKCMDLALKGLQKYIHRKISEKQSLFKLVKNENINERQAEILRSLITYRQKSFTIKSIQNKFGVVYQTARTDLIGLEELGYLKEKKLGKKLFFFTAENFDEKIKALNSI